MRFPYETGNHGDIYLSILGVCFYVGNAYYDCRITVGRHSKASTGRAYKVCTRNSLEVVGIFGVLAGFYSRILFSSGRMDFGIYWKRNEWFR